jgi:hypothetical protein
MAKKMEQSEELLGTCWGTHWELGKHVKNSMETMDEYYNGVKKGGEKKTF